MMKTLLLSRSFDWDGGVVNFVETLKKNFPENVFPEAFVIGCRKNSNSFSRLLTPPKDAFKLCACLKRSSYDVVHLNPSLNITSLLRDGLFMLALRLCKSKAVLVTWHGWDVHLAERLRIWPLKMLFQITFGYAASMWVLASSFGKQLRDLGIDNRKIHRYTTMFDGSIFEGVTRNRADDTIRLLFLSRFERTKGIYELLEAFKEIREQHDNVELVFTGDGPEMATMREWVRNHKLDDCISFTGYLRDRDKVLVLLNADIFVFPTYYGEGCPVSLLEAMAAGLPVITAPAGGIPDIFENEKNGYLLSEVTPTTIKEAVLKFLGDSVMRYKIGEHNRQEAWEKYEAKVVTRKVVQHYFALTGKEQGVVL